jgi:phage portal protein BeeE
MAIFKRGVTKAAISPQETANVTAAAGGTYAGNGSGEKSIGQYYSYVQGEMRNKAMQVATINRARDLLASVVASTPLKLYKKTWNEAEGEMEEKEVKPRAWMNQPDPQLSYSAFMSWLLDDLFFMGRAFLWVSSRDAQGLPNSFTRLPAAMVNTLDISPPVFAYGMSHQIFFQGAQIPTEDVIQFIGGNQGIIYQSPQVIETSLSLQAARLRNSSSALPAGVLKQTSGEPLSGQELSELAQSFELARRSNQIAAINQFVEWQPTDVDASKMLLSEAAEFESKEAARMCNIPFFLNGNSVGSYSYQSNAGARKDLVVFGARAYMLVIEQTLSMMNVVPPDYCVRFDIDEYLSDSEMTESKEENEHEPSAKELAEIVQKVYLGVDKVITADEGRAIINMAGIDLPVPSPTELPVQIPTAPQGN